MKKTLSEHDGLSYDETGRRFFTGSAEGPGIHVTCLGRSYSQGMVVVINGGKP
jgi:hypothetical protein